jgi:hypothetical protein
VIKSYKDLLAWQKSMDLVTMVYELTRQFPREELFGLATSMRRATVAIPSKIASGQIEVAKRLSYIDDEQQAQFTRLASDTGKIINGLMNSMERYAVAHAR